VRQRFNEPNSRCRPKPEFALSKVDRPGATLSAFDLAILKEKCHCAAQAQHVLME
jgi:hypothetical protein